MGQAFLGSLVSKMLLSQSNLWIPSIRDQVKRGVEIRSARC